MSFHVPPHLRLRTGPMASSEADGNNGAFILEHFMIVASDGMGWEHVSVSLPDRCPTWDEMCRIKDLFWDAEDAVIQVHPPKGEHVNCHPFCLHLWRPTDAEVPLPPFLLVGPK